jgi:hypothetical protein
VTRLLAPFQDRKTALVLKGFIEASCRADDRMMLHDADGKTGGAVFSSATLMMAVLPKQSPRRNDQGQHFSG